MTVPVDGDPLLTVRDLHTTFATARGAVRAVSGVSFDLTRGRSLGVVGESGSGKTVLLRSVMGLLPANRATCTGSVRLEGTEIVGAPPAVLRSLWGSRVSMVFQDPMTALNPVQRVGRQIAEPLRIHLGLDRAEARAQAVSLLAQVGIPDPERRSRDYPDQLSGGMRQRVLIAVAVACAPRLLLADEPTTGLDVTVQAQILDLLAELTRERRMATVLVTHDLGVVATRTDRIMVMYAGRIVEEAATSALFAGPAMPYTEALLEAVPRLTEPAHRRLATIGGHPPDPLSPTQGCPFAPRCRYARDLCRRAAPPFVGTDDPDHRFACWFPLGGRTGPDPRTSS